MNKVLMLLSVVGLLAVGGIVVYINLPREDRRQLPQGDAAQQPEGKSEPTVLLKPKVVVETLDSPCAVAIQPKTGHVFVSTRSQVLRVVPGEETGVFEEIVGFPIDSYGRGPEYEFGPLGLAFVGEDELVVGGGGKADGEDIVRLYKVGDAPPSEPRQADEMSRFTTNIPASKKSIQGEGNFFGIVVHDSTIFVTCNGDDTKGWISKADLKPSEKSPIPLRHFISSKLQTFRDAPTGITLSPEKKLVVSQVGNVNVRNDSMLTFYDPETGALEKKMETGLRDLVAIAYHPKTGELYGVDFAWAKAKEGGLYHLVIDGDEVKARKVASLIKPTGLAFAADGRLFVSVMGASLSEERKSGQLLVFTKLSN